MGGRYNPSHAYLLWSWRPNPNAGIAINEIIEKCEESVDDEGEEHGGEKGPSTVHHMKVSLRESYTGFVKKLVVKRKELCPACRGSGIGCAYAKRLVCGACGGDGRTVHLTRFGPLFRQIEVSCDACSGKGLIIDPRHRCAECAGTGHARMSRRLTATIPRGVRSGDTVRLEGEGDCGAGGQGGPPGDIVLNLAVATSDEQFVWLDPANGDLDLLRKHRLSLADALLGRVDFRTKHLDGRELHILYGGGGGGDPAAPPDAPIPPGTCFRVVGEGMPNPENPFLKGDLLVVFDVEFPRSPLSPAARRLADQLLISPSSPPPATEQGPQTTAEVYHLDDLSPQQRARWKAQASTSSMIEGACELNSNEAEALPRGEDAHVQCPQS